MKLPHLSHRLQAIVDLLGEGGAHYGTVADVGCDHGWVSITLVQKGITDRVIASDVRPGPLERAKEHVAQYGLEEKIETVLSDGLSHIGPHGYGANGDGPKQQKKTVMTATSVDAAVIAGMGGMLICDILNECAGREALPQHLVLQPQLSWQEVRQCLRKHSYQILTEDMVKEDGKFYVMMHAKKMRDDRKRDSRETEIADRFGPRLLEKKHPVLKEWLLAQHENYTKIKGNLSDDHEDRDGIEKKLYYLDEALRHFDM